VGGDVPKGCLNLTCRVVDMALWEKEVFSLLLICYAVEKVPYGDSHAELAGDDDLRISRNFEQAYKEHQRSALKAKHSIQALR
jgi:hypothetical protein